MEDHDDYKNRFCTNNRYSIKNDTLKKNLIKETCPRGYIILEMIRGYVNVNGRMVIVNLLFVYVGDREI